MALKSLTYTSLAALDLSADDLRAIYRAARNTNALEGISGLLVFNGVHFLQILEGAPDAVDDLLARLRHDPRHSAVEVRDQRAIEHRSFGGWAMELVQVKTRFTDARETLRAVLPANLPEDVRERVFRMTREISGAVELDD